MKFLVLPRRVKGVGVAAALAACVAMTALPVSATGPGARPAQGPALPDLVVGVDRLRSSLIISNRSFSSNSCSFVEGCIAQTGSRRILQFDMQIINQGNADAVLGRPQDNPELFEFSPCHGHYHMSDTLDYSMARAGRDSVGIYNSSTGAFFLKNKNGVGPADVSFVFGGAGGAVPVTGDWDGDGDATIGIYVPSTGAFFLRNSNTPGNADVTLTFGAANGGYTPVVGDWDGDGDDTIGLYQASTGVFFLKNANTNGPADLTFAFGTPSGYTPVVGDWDGDDIDSIGLYQASSGAFFLRNANSAGNADLAFVYGTGGALKPLAGDWNIDGADTVGLYDPATGAYFLRNLNEPGPADESFVFGTGGVDAVQIANDWDYDQEGDSLPGYTGLKQAFCWLDSQRVFGTAPPRYNCGNQGITQGWSDIYGRSLDCQWIDITGLAAGKYQLRVSVNDSQQLLQESDYSNNFAALKVRITAPASAAKAPTVRITSPTGGERYKVGRPVTITWEVTDPENMTHQEVWFLPIDKHHPANKHGGSGKEDAIARAKLLVENLPPSARSFTWVPSEDYTGGPGAFLVRTTDSVNMVGSDSVSKGRIRVKK